MHYCRISRHTSNFHHIHAYNKRRKQARTGPFMVASARLRARTPPFSGVFPGFPWNFPGFSDTLSFCESGMTSQDTSNATNRSHTTLDWTHVSLAGRAGGESGVDAAPTPRRPIHTGQNGTEASGRLWSAKEFETRHTL